MDLISAFFDKYRKLTPPDEAVRKAVQRIVKEEMGIDLELKDIKVSYFDVIIKVGGMAKAAIMIKQDKVLSKLEEQFGAKSPKKIK